MADDSMGKLFQLPLDRRRMSKQEKKLMEVSDEIDAIILKHLADEDIDLKTLAGVIAHRLGTLLSRIDRKQELWEVCARIAKDRAQVS